MKCLCLLVLSFFCLASSGVGFAFQTHNLPLSAIPRIATSAPVDVKKASWSAHKRCKLSVTIFSTSTGSGIQNEEKPKIDTGALAKYVIAVAVQMSFFAGIFKVLDLLIQKYSLSIPLPAVGFLFYVLALRSRVFNPLDNRRPSASKDKNSPGFRDRVMPKWTPPGFIFPIVWLLLIGPTRAATSAMVYRANGNLFFHPAILSLMLHLSIGDVWNTIDNTEKRYGASVSAVYCVWLSAVFAAYQYYKVEPLAGKLLGATAIWLTIASALVTQFWRLNPLSDGKRDALYPVVGETKTKFAWFSKKEG